MNRLISYMLFFILIGCSAIDTRLSAEADIIGGVQSIQSNNLFVYVGSDLSKEELALFTRKPEYIIGYWTKITNETLIINEVGRTGTIEDIKPGHIVKVWTHEYFYETRTKYHDEITYEDYPKFTAVKLEIVKISKEEVLSRMVSDVEGKYAVYAFLQQMDSELSNTILRAVNIEENRNIQSLSIQELKEEAIIDYREIFDLKDFLTILVFDDKGMVLRTSKLEELRDFLKN